MSNERSGKNVKILLEVSSPAKKIRYVTCNTGEKNGMWFIRILGSLWSKKKAMDYKHHNLTHAFNTSSRTEGSEDAQSKDFASRVSER